MTLALPKARVYGASTISTGRRLPGAVIPKPTREQVCKVNTHFQGLTVSTKKFGPDRHWFDPDVAQCELLEDRHAFYDEHLKAGDTHINLSLDTEGLASLWRIVAIAKEAIEYGFTGIILCCMGDGHTVNGRNSDPGALGFDWLMRNFPNILTACVLERVGDHNLADHILFAPGYDGCVPDWQPPSSNDRFFLYARRNLDQAGSGYLAAYFSSGYAVWGDENAVEGNNFTTAAGKALDAVLYEGPIETGPPAPVPPGAADVRWTQMYQIVDRMVRPYHEVPGQPDDHMPPFLLSEGTPRGPIYFCYLEHYCYLWTLPWRHPGSGGCTLEQIEIARKAIRDAGVESVG